MLEDRVRFCTGCGYPIHTLRNEKGGVGGQKPNQPPRVPPAGQAHGPDPRPAGKQAGKQAEKTPEKPAAQQGKGQPGQPGRPAKNPVKRAVVAAAIVLFVAAAGTGGVALALYTAGQGGEENFLQEASRLLEDGSYADCIAYTQDALLEDENNPQLLTILGEAQARQGDYEDAVTTFSRLDPGDLDSGALLRYAEALLRSGQLQQMVSVMDRYLDQLEQPAQEDMDLLAEAAAAALQKNEQALLEQCVDMLGSWMDGGLTGLEWNLETAESLVDSALASPVQETLTAAASYYLKAAEQAGLTTEVQEKLADCFAAWRQVDADPWKADWACYQALMTAAPGYGDGILAAYIQYIGQPDAQLDVLAENVKAQYQAGSLTEENGAVDPQPICDAILQACAQQNGSSERLQQIQSEMSAQNYRQAVALWEADPWLQGCSLWYQGGTVSLWPLDTAGDCVYLSPEGVYFGQIAAGKQEGTGVMVMRGSDGHILYSAGQWTGGVTTAAWTDLDEVQQAERSAGSSGAASKAASSASRGASSTSRSSSRTSSASSGASSQKGGQAPAAASSQTPPAASSQAPASSAAPAPVDQQTLEEMMRQAEQQAQSMLDVLS